MSGKRKPKFKGVINVINQMGIIADDLTGANDSGVQLAKKGLSSTVILDYRQSGDAAPADVLIVDTDSRAKQGAEAYEAAYGAAHYLKRHGYGHIYKKVDSTLRGNMAEELRAVEQVFRPDLMLIAPAFPKMNRVTVGGHHYVNGSLITDTEFAKDPKTPVTESFIPGLLQAGAGREVGLIDASLLRGPADELAAYVNQAISHGQTWLVCDSESEQDLRTIAAFFSSWDRSIVWAGSAGLIEYLPEALALKPSGSGEEAEALAGKTLVVSGSLSRTTRQQLTKVGEMAEACMLEVDPVDLVRGDTDADRYVRALEKSSDKPYAVLYVDGSEHNRISAKAAGDQLGLSLTEVSEAISRGLGHITREILQAFEDIEGLVLTGGDTAKAVCQELGIGEMQLHSEAEPGLPFGKLQGKGRSYWAITKAGGFGRDESLVDALQYMTTKKRVRV